MTWRRLRVGSILVAGLVTICLAFSAVGFAQTEPAAAGGG